jgi:chromosome segregation protein
MKLKSLRLHGFKSFADRTELEFREGVTAIIGSNGCGKSNIADAVRWVLGEQRASAIRGARMEEAIFQGTARRRPLNFAEVTLLFDNASGRVPVPQTEIEVARKVFREGGSEYSLNRNACRLRDIHDLLRDTGLGSNAYAIIEAGMIETLLSDRAEERRLLFEEAAGIGRYKDSRHAATRRLESAESDLARLGDLIGEVESKVRLLGRQKRKAERHQELHASRLELEVAIARHELAGLGQALHDAERRIVELEHEQRSAAAERSMAEARVEEQRAEAAEMAHQRAEISGRLDRVRGDIDAREREILLAQERKAHAELRSEQLRREREETVRRLEALGAEAERIETDRIEAGDVLAAARARLEAHATDVQALRARLVEERAATEAAAGRAHGLSREIATAEGERAGAERRRREGEERATVFGAEDTRLAAELRALTAQTELWSSRTDDLRARFATAQSDAAAARDAVRTATERERVARGRAREVEAELSRVQAQVDAREALERSYEGFAPAVAAIMSASPRITGVLGPLADFLPGDPSAPDTATIEAYLGPLLQALVVDDLRAARAVRRWFREEWSGGGALLLLPVDALGDAREPRAWASSLLGELVMVDSDPLDDGYSPGLTRVGPDGVMVDARGIVRLLERGEGEGILARRAELARLRARRDEAAAEAGSAVADLDAARTSLAEAESTVRVAEETRTELETELRRAEMDSASHEHRTGRLHKDRAALAETLQTLRTSIGDASARMASLEKRLAELSIEVAEAASADDAARARLGELEARWDAARDLEAELRVAVARAEAAVAENARRITDATRESAASRTRIEGVDRELDQLQATLSGLSGVREQAAEAIELLFAARDEETARLALLDGRLAEIDSELAELGERVRISRRREQEAGEEKHRIQLEAAEARSRVERVRERLEVEWGRTWDALSASAGSLTEGTPESWRGELAAVNRQIELLGPVNMLAVEEHEEEARRLEFLTTQRDDLTAARDDLVAAIRQINRTARDLFLGTFETVRENFQHVFESLFEGGECDIVLADPEDPLESLVEIRASPKGKRTQRIHLLSGGERTLTALALLFALYLVKPSPFCVLDEIDAPLDETNVDRFIQLLQKFKADTQFIVITHHPRTMQSADWVYGVTMEEPGVSNLVGVELLDAWSAENRVA